MLDYFDERYRPFPFPDYRKRYERDRNFKQVHIFVDLLPDFNEKKIYAREEITLRAIYDDLDRVDLDAYEMKIHHVMRNNEELNFIYDGKRISIIFPRKVKRGEEIRLGIEYSTRPRRGIFFVSPDEHYPDKPLQLWSQGEDEDTRYWLPCYDFPNERSTTEIRITLPQDFYAVSNGVLIKDEILDGKRVMHWKESFPHPIYLTSIAAGRFFIQEDEIDGIKLQYIVPEGKRDLWMRSFINTPDMIRHFSRILNYPYPYSKYSQVVVNDFIFGGMENINATTLTEFTLHDERMHNDYISEGLVSHELAHQWFGDLITCRDWSHAWLNEGFATYMNAVYFEHFLGHDDFLYTLYQDEMNYKNELSSEYARPIVTNVYEYPGELFDRHLYEKASRVLHMLRDEIGDEKFWWFINTYLNSYAGRSIDTYDFISLLKEKTGKSMDFFFDQWLFHAGHPVLDISYTYDISKRLLRLTIEQKQEGKDIPDVFIFRLRIAFYHGDEREVREVRVESRKQDFTFTMDMPDAISIDPENTILKDMKFERNTTMLISQARKGTAMEKIEAIRELSRKGGMDAIECLRDEALKDNFWAVRREAILSLGKIKTRNALDALLEIKENIINNRTVDSRVRTALSEALGNFPGEEKALKALEDIISMERKYAPVSKAFESVGRIKHAKSFDILLRGLAMDSWNEIIRQGVMRGLAELNDTRGVDIALENSRLGKHVLLRSAAVLALGRLGEGKRDVLPWLHVYLRDPYLQVRRAAVQAIGNVGLMESINELENAFASELDAHVKRSIRKTINDIIEGRKEKEEIRNLRQDLDDLRKKVMELYERVGK
ncbi:MAG: M1 family aminopeptidase [Thermoplasmata archaeon]